MALDFERYKGLSAAEVARQQRKSGSNILFEKQRKGFLHYAMGLFEEPMLMLLLATAILYFAMGEAWDGVLMIAGVLLMIGIEIYQEAKTDKALDALKELSTPKIAVIRDGRLQSIDNQGLVTGDLLVVREGERVAGDGQILESSNFSVDESMLTGESGAIFKTQNEENASDDAKTGKPRQTDKDDTSRVYAGTLCLTGQAVIKVTAIGIKTQYGQIGESLAEVQEPPTPLQIKTGKLVRIFGAIGLSACVALSLINYVHTGQLVDSLLKGLTLAISVIPEELPVILTVFAALGAYRLTKKNALIRKINAIETLGSITTLCTDKTGTLTLNQMELKVLLTETGVHESRRIDLKDPKQVLLLTRAVLTCQPEPFDPADLSIFECANKAGLDTDELHQRHTLLREYGFEPHLRSMGLAWRTGGKVLLVAKGSAEQLLEHCSLTSEKRATLIKEVDGLALKGLRVLAVASRELEEEDLPESLGDINDLEFVTLLGYHDPPRPEAKRAVLACQRAGISVRMITGDHPQTALHIAQAVGIRHKDKVVTGAEIESLSEDQLMERLKNTYIFARVIPNQKLKIVHALQRSGEIVAMIGDGVNDAPSLKESNVGIAMGRKGTNVAREASDMILMDDQLNTVVNAIHDGRRIFDNIQKGVSYVFGIHVYIILIALTIPLMGLPALLLPIHIILLELVIDPTCSLVLEAMPAEADTMQRKPRDPKQPLIARRSYLKIVLKGFCIFFITAATYLLAMHYGQTTEVARTLGFSVILWSNLFQVISLVSRTKPAFFSLDFMRNKTFLIVYAIVLVGYVSLLYLPMLNHALGLATIPLNLFFLTILLGAIPALISDVYKIWRYRRT
jgi:Ca2+-transporting ATPase